MLTDTFIRVTFPNELSERDERLVSLIVTESIADYMVLSEDSNLVEAAIYETEQGHTMEFPATTDISDTDAEKIFEGMSKFFQDFELEVSGNQ